MLVPVNMSAPLQDALSTLEYEVGNYLTDDEYRQLQRSMLENPEAGDVMPRTGGFRKLRWSDGRRGKGKRGAK